ncbi:MAG: hypothetical protein AAF483_15270 [Planctomycetota bacterium]
MKTPAFVLKVKLLGFWLSVCKLVLGWDVAQQNAVFDETAVAFLVEANGKKLLYSGDLRWHGRKPGMINSLVEKVTSCSA